MANPIVSKVFPIGSVTLRQWAGLEQFISVGRDGNN